MNTIRTLISTVCLALLLSACIGERVPEVDETILKPAYSEYDKGNYSYVIQSLEQWMKSSTYPTVPDASMEQRIEATELLALSYCISGQPDPCREKLRAIIPLVTSQEYNPSSVILNRARHIFYEKGNYDGTTRLLTILLELIDAKSLDTSIEQQIEANKLAAFSYCLTSQADLCRQKFRAIFTIKPDFELSLAEKDHPIWGPVFNEAKREFSSTVATIEATEPAAAIETTESVAVDRSKDNKPLRVVGPRSLRVVGPFHR